MSGKIVFQAKRKGSRPRKNVVKQELRKEVKQEVKQELNKDYAIKIKSKGKKKESKYTMVLLHPFNPRSFGATIPDLFCLPLNQRFVRNTFQVSGVSADFAIYASPWLSIYSNNTTPIAGGGTSITLLNGQQIKNCATLTQMAALFDQYRVVAVGIKITNLATATNATGRLTLAHLASPDFIAIAGAGDQQTPDYNAINGFPATDGTGYYTGDILTQPSAKLYTGMEIAQQGIETSLRPISFEAFGFRETNSQVSVGTLYSEGNDLEITNSTGVAKATANSDLAKIGGWSTLIGTCRGFPSGTNLEIELIYHLEGTTDMSASTNSTSGGGCSMSVDMQDLFQSLEKFSKAPVYKPVENHGGSYGALLNGMNL